MKNSTVKKYFVSLLLLVFAFTSKAQGGLERDPNAGFSGGSNGVNYNNQQSNTRSKADSGLKQRDKFADSVTIYFKYFDSTKTRVLDSSLNDFSIKLNMPFYFTHLGNMASASKSLLFMPNLQCGFDAGFHQFDVYQYTIEKTRLFKTTRPVTELSYLLGSESEQFINVLHTQNNKDNLNFSFEYRFINAPGVFKNQNASLNNLRFALHYQSPNKRFHVNTIYISNSNAASENGGVKDAKQLDSLVLGNPFELAVRLGPSNIYARNPFNTTVYTGNTYSNATLLVRSQYDLGQKDSIKTDSTLIKIFYPQFRLQHQLQIKNSSYLFNDFYADSAKYSNYFGYVFTKKNKVFDTIKFQNNFTQIDNEFSILSYPDKKNISQFIRFGGTLQNFIGNNSINKNHTFYNILANAEYRNTTKNKIWDVEAFAQLYINGFNAGDYTAFISLKRLLSKNLGRLQIGFNNINKSPSYIFTSSSEFAIKNLQSSYNKENISKIWANYYNNRFNFSVVGNYYLLSNYLYFDSFFTAKQEATLFNVLHIGFEKKFNLSKYWHLYSEIHFQQSTANAPINIPTLITRQRLAFEGNFYTNLFVSTGLEVKYNSSYKPSGYSPIMGQFFYQNGYNIANRPDINLFFDFRIKSFKGFFRVENLNTLLPPSGSKEYNYAADQYPMQTLWMRFGIWWSFVN
jgi:Putative porin